MKLKGKNAEKLKGDKKKKMDKTLKRMEETRNKASIDLKEKINTKIEFLTSEKVKAVSGMESLKQKICNLEEMKLKIDGAIIVLKELIANDTNV